MNASIRNINDNKEESPREALFSLSITEFMQVLGDKTPGRFKEFEKLLSSFLRTKQNLKTISNKQVHFYSEQKHGTGVNYWTEGGPGIARQERKKSQRKVVFLRLVHQKQQDERDVHTTINKPQQQSATSSTFKDIQGLSLSPDFPDFQGFEMGL